MHFSDEDLKHLQTKLSDKNTWIKLLDASIGQAINNSLILTQAKKGVGFDQFSYLDSLFYLSEVLDPHGFHFGPLSPDLLTGSCVCQWHDNSSPINTEVVPGKVLASSSIILMNFSALGEDYKRLKRLMGFHNLSSNEVLFTGKKINIVIPFEMTVLLDKKALPNPNVPASLMFALEPTNKVFEISLTPAPVSALIVDNNMPAAMGYVVHPNILFEHLKSVDGWRDARYEKSTDEDIKSALQWDTQMALKMLKHRYLLDIDDAYLKRISDMDEKIKQLHDEHGAVVLEM